MKSTAILCTAMVAASLLLASCTSSQSPVNPPAAGTGWNMPSAQVPSMVDPYQQAPSVTETIEKVGEKIKDETVFKGCMARMVQSCASEVISSYAQGDTADVCNNFKDASLRDACTSSVTVEIAKKKADPSLCASLPDGSKTLCTEQVTVAKAIAEKDPKLCDALSSGQKSGSGQLLPGLGEPRDRCVMQVIGWMPGGRDAQELCKMLNAEDVRKVCVQDAARRMEMQTQMEKMQKSMNVAPPAAPVTQTASGNAPTAPAIVK